MYKKLRKTIYTAMMRNVALFNGIKNEERNGEILVQNTECIKCLYYKDTLYSFS